MGWKTITHVSPRSIGDFQENDHETRWHAPPGHLTFQTVPASAEPLSTTPLPLQPRILTSCLVSQSFAPSRILLRSQWSLAPTQ